jgi:hypothetical protein
MVKTDQLERMMNLALNAMERKLESGDITAAEFSAVLKAFKDAGLSLAIDGKPTMEAVDAVMDAMKDYEPDFLN